jgi:SAM-dependent methyltransferase
MNQPASVDPSRFEDMYRDERTSHGLPTATPWDIGGPQPAVQQLVAVGAINGEVLDPGTGPGHHAIYYASKGYSVTGIDISPTGLQRARENARKAGVSVNFQLADATKLEGLENRFDTVVDSAFYHTFRADPGLQNSYARALHRATRPGARLYMFECGPGDVNGLRTGPRSPLFEDDFRQVLPGAGWEITYLGPTTCQANVSAETFDVQIAQHPDVVDRIKPMAELFQIIEPWLTNGRVHGPIWEVHATRVD